MTEVSNTEAHVSVNPPPPPPAASKPKRVRTGCLTCRERHLKCDEGQPICQNCKKSNRDCKRGVRLNFIDITVGSPPQNPGSEAWQIAFQDESREIASEYRGGLSRYAKLDMTASITPPADKSLEYPLRNMSIDSQMASATMTLPPIEQGSVQMFPDHMRHDLSRRESVVSHHSHSNSESSYLQPPSAIQYNAPDQNIAPDNDVLSYLTDPEQVLFMQVYVEEVGIWMDSMDSNKQFSRILPFYALSQPMLRYAFLACGARHLCLVNSDFPDDKALFYYDSATTLLLKSLQNPDRDTSVCATTAVVLNVYEIMSERALQRMNHIAGARALIKECGWNARSGGVGAACFWLNVGMELLSCLHFNWQVAWEPDMWGVDMDFSTGTETGREDIWVHRILYLTGKIANFRATIPRFQEASPLDEQNRIQKRFAEWQKITDLCNQWNHSIPRSMQPLAYLYPGQTSSKSAFPEVWLIKRATLVGRLFYHQAMCLLAQINPIQSGDEGEMYSQKMTHAHQICGIVAHVKDRGVASVALRSLAIAGECLTERREQDEVVEIFTKIQKEAGWNISFVLSELEEKWGWKTTCTTEQQLLQQPINSSHTQIFPTTTSMDGTATMTATLPPAPMQQQQQQQSQNGMGGHQTRKIPSGVLNPLLKTADFSHPNHPYPKFWTRPNQNTHYSNRSLGNGLASLGNGLGSLGNGSMGPMGSMAGNLGSLNAFAFSAPEGYGEVKVNPQ